MTPKIKIEEIISIISSKISVSDKDINENSKSSDFYKWDSLAQLNIILEIEQNNYSKYINFVEFTYNIGLLFYVFKFLRSHLKKIQVNLATSLAFPCQVWLSALKLRKSCQIV